MSKVKIYISSILIPVIIGGLVGVITSGFMDYNLLQKPFLSPPGIVFPIVWTILYTLMGVSYGMMILIVFTIYNYLLMHYGQYSFLYLSGDYSHLFGYYY